MQDNDKNNIELLYKSLGHLEVILKMTRDINNYNEFCENPLIKDITLLHLGQIGELCKRFTNEFKIKNNNIDYRAIAGLRNIAVHDYSGINYNEIYNTIKNDVPVLKENYKSILLDNYKIDEEKLNDFLKVYLETRRFLKDI